MSTDWLPMVSISSPGRWFAADEVGEIHNNEVKFPPSVVITQNIAKALFPDGHALGAVLYFFPTGSSRIVGIVAKMQRPSDALGGSPMEIPGPSIRSSCHFSW